MQPLIPYFQPFKIEIPAPFLESGSWTVYGFGLALVIGFFAAQHVSMNRAKRVGQSELVIGATYLLGIGTMFFGAHLWYGLFYAPPGYFNDLTKLFAFNEGLSSLGGVLISGIVIAVWFRIWKQPFLKSADCMMLGLAVGGLCARIGCFLMHGHPGKESSFFLARYCRPVEGHTIAFPEWMRIDVPDFRFGACIEENAPVITSFVDYVPVNYQGVVAVHDTALYEAIYILGMFLVFRWMDRKELHPGSLVVAGTLLYAPFRFFIDFVRDDWAPVFMLSYVQWGCIALLVFGFILLRLYPIAKWTKADKSNEKTVDSTPRASGKLTEHTA